MTRACLLSQATLATPAPAPDAAAEPTRGPVDLGLWSIYTGAVVQTAVLGLHDDANGFPQPIDLVIDLGTLALPALAPALSDHADVVGNWRELAIHPALGVMGRLSVYRDDAVGCDMLERANEIRIAASQGHPWQASIGAEPGPAGRYERLTGPTEINGTEITPGPDRPLFILYGGRLTEASVVLFGADRQTGRVAASRSTTQRSTHREHSMSDHVATLSRLVARFGANRKSALAVRLMEGAPEEAISDEETASLRAALADATAQIATATAEVAALKAQIEDLKPKEGDEQAPPGGAGDTQLAAPKNKLQAIELQNAKGLKGIAALRAARAAHPNLI
jgi:hypothetical protein